MNPNSQKAMVVAIPLVACLFFAPFVCADPPTTAEKLDKILVPRVEMEKAPLADALEFLRIASEDLDKLSPRDDPGKGINFVLRDPTGDLAGLELSMTLNQIPMRTLLNYIVRMSGITYRIDEHAVVIGREAELKAGSGFFMSHALDEQSRKVYALLADIRLPAVSIEDATLDDAIDFFRKVSLGPEGDGPSFSFIVKNPGFPFPKLSLHLKDVPLGVALSYACELSGVAYKIDAYAIVIGKPEDLSPKPFDPGAHAYGRSGVKDGGIPLAKRLQELVIEKVELRSATIDDAFALIRTSAVEFEKAEGKAHPEGINLVNLAQGNENEFSLSLRNIPAWELLEYVAALTDTEFRVEEIAVVVDWKLPRKDSSVEGPKTAPLEIPEVPEIDRTKVFEVPGGVVPDQLIPRTSIGPLILP